MNLRQKLTRNSVQITNLRHYDKFGANNALRTNFDQNFGASNTSLLLMDIKFNHY